MTLFQFQQWTCTLISATTVDPEAVIPEEDPDPKAWKTEIRSCGDTWMTDCSAGDHRQTESSSVTMGQKEEEEEE